MSHDPRAVAWGRAAENAARSAFTKLGYFVVPAHAIEDGGAPMLVGLLQKYVLPDFLIAKDGRTRWVEVKFKDHCVRFQITGFFRHGIDLPKWHAYRKVEEVTGIPGSIAVLQYRPGANADPCQYLLQQSFARLSRTVDFDPRPLAHAPHGMAYWNVDEMDILCRLDFDFTDVPALAHRIHAWEQKAKDGSAPQARMGFKQRSLFSYDRGDTERE